MIPVIRLYYWCIAFSLFFLFELEAINKAILWIILISIHYEIYFADWKESFSQNGKLYISLKKELKIFVIKERNYINRQTFFNEDISHLLSTLELDLFLY